MAVAAALALSGVPLAAHAAGLGKITVFSALGQPLQAEVELSASRDELSGMSARLAAPEAFRAAGLDFPSSLLDIKFAVDKRPDGKPFIRLTSSRPINDPFVDMLVEINWPTGRLVREYTFLLDPPEARVKAPTPVVSAEERPTARPAAPAPAPAPTAPAPRAAPRVAEEAGTPAVPPAAPPPPAAVPAERKAADFHEIKRGETLRKIAAEYQHENVTLEQMLVGLLRANPGAFEGGNMNRMHSGKILTVPDRDAVAAVPDKEAKRVVVAQSSDWNSYRRKLAGTALQAPARDEGAAAQEASGRITARVEEKTAPAARPRDQVRVSKSDDGRPGAAEELVAKERALKEANDRLAQLEKNVSELQKLLELKNQNLAELQKQAAARAEKPAEAAKPAVTPPPAEAPKPAEPPKPVEAAKPAEPPKAVEPAKTPEAPKPAEAAKTPDAEKPAEAPKAAEPAKPAEAPKPPPRRPAPPPPPPPPEPSFLEELLDNPLNLAAGGGVIAALLGGLWYRRRRQQQEETKEVPLAGVGSTLSQASLGANSVFRSTGGQSVDTSHTPPQTDFSQAGPGTIDTDEVDPVAEADVYMAYGRDAQAEEILLEAKQKDPTRHAVHLKLLEIYANRKSVKQFETLATELYGETGGVGSEWEKAAAMGQKLDPQNPLYGGSGGAAAPAAFDADATVIVPALKTASTVTIPGQLAQMAAAAEAAAEPQAPQPAPVFSPEPEPHTEPGADDMMSLDFDLGVPEAPVAAPAAPAAPEAPAALEFESTLALPEAALAPAEDAPLDFDLGVAEPAAADLAVAPLDFDLPAAPAEAPAPVDEVLDFDLGLESEPVADAGGAADGLPDFDLSAPLDVAATPAAAAEAAEGIDEIGAIDADALEFDVQLTDSTVLGSPVQAPSFDMGAISLDLDEPAPAPAAATDFEVAQAATVVNPSLSAFSELPDFDLGAPAADQSQTETVVNPELLQPEAFEEVPINEEVATKLDLAKAYEEMGDLEGARELLKEVLGEGSPEQQAMARDTLGRIGE